MTELSVRGTFLVYFNQGSFHPERSLETLRPIDGIVGIQRKVASNPHIYRVTVDAS